MSGAPQKLVELFSDKELAQMGYSWWTRTEIIKNPTEEQVEEASPVASKEEGETDE